MKQPTPSTGATAFDPESLPPAGDRGLDRNAGISGPGQAQADRVAREDAVVELLVDWGAAAQPDAGDLLKAIASLRNAADLLRALHQKGRDLLPAELRDEMDRVIAILGTGGSLGAPSFRSRLDQMVAVAQEALEPRIAERRAAVAAQLKSWAILLDPAGLERSLQGLWRSERAAGLADQIGTLEDLDRICEALQEARRAATAEIEPWLAAGAPGGAADGVAELARNALQSGDPSQLLRVRQALQDRRTRDEHRVVAERCAAARSRLAALCEQARREPGPAGSASNGGAARLRVKTVEGAESLLRATAAPAWPTEQGDSLEQALVAWERALRTVLEADGAAGDAGRRARRDLAGAFRAEMERLGTDGHDPREAAAPAPDTGTAEAALRETALGGGLPFQEAVDRAADLLRRAGQAAETRVKEAAARLRLSASDLTSFLESRAAELPTPRVVRARLWLEQVDGIVAARRVDGIESLDHAIREDLEALRGLAAHAQRRRANREEAERESLREEAARLAEVAPRRTARRLQALLDQAQRADGERLAGLRERLDLLRHGVEHAIRLEAARSLRSGERRARKAGAGAAARRPEAMRNLARCVGEISAAMQKDDLATLRDRTGEVRSALRAVAPLSRPWVRIALAVAASAVLAGGLAYWSGRRDLPQAYTLKLDGRPQQPVSVWLVRDGRIVEKAEYAKEAEGVTFDLRPGRFEVFVDRRYTGRVIRVPGDREVSGIPCPPVHR
ncbi:MAG: hypothetical protein HYS34_01795 [Acidobacteria bacterium]|nr:hypothetical protein [Acidobacteriota bacterium]